MHVQSLVALAGIQKHGKSFRSCVRLSAAGSMHAEERTANGTARKQCIILLDLENGRIR
jgi:hypothetical protein